MRRVRLNVDDTVFKFLGIHIQQFREDHEGFFDNRAGTITGLSGMTIALPAWRIFEVLEKDELRSRRSAREVVLKEKAKKLPMAEKKPKKNDKPAEPDRQRFKRLLDAAVKPPKPSDRT